MKIEFVGFYEYEEHMGNKKFVTEVNNVWEVDNSTFNNNQVIYDTVMKSITLISDYNGSIRTFVSAEKRLNYLYLEKERIEKDILKLEELV